ncbi:MAG: hypothetical protein HOI53_01555 [Francisellaceae bacterium]|nr:hypothetical protein [Francisellaceae bacterium]MBT6538769.1 hypothetical protein [Francisellaceae bacterium]
MTNIMSLDNNENDAEEISEIDVNSTSAESQNGIGRVFGAGLLIAGTSIGAGMLGLPVKTAAAGFYSTSIAYVAVWLIMLSTALMTLEVSFYFKGKTNMISMASATIGPMAGKIMKVVYLLFFYSVMASYTTQGVSLTSIAIESGSTSSLFSQIFSMLCFVTPFALIVFMGAYWVDQINRGFIFGIAICFALLVVMVLNNKTQLSMEPGSIVSVLPALSLIVTSLGFHGIIPSLKSYLNEDIKKIRAAIVLGSMIPVVVYILWQYVILSHVPIWGANGLVNLSHAIGNPGEKLISAISSKSSYASLIVVVFSLCAIFSSYVGVALGITDFLFDAFKNIKNASISQISIVLLTFIPPVIFAIAYPSGFMMALSYAGIFAAVLLVIFPALMMYLGRSKSQLNLYRVKFGRPLALLALIFGVSVVLLEISIQFNFVDVKFF